MPVQLFHYRPLAIARICARELSVQAFVLLPILLAQPIGQYARKRDFYDALTLLPSQLCLQAIVATIYCLWRIPTLRSVQVRFDGNELVRVGHDGRRGLVASEVVAIIKTSRLLHIVSGRQDYTITIHRELDRFPDLRAKLGEWLPAHANAIQPPRRASLKRFLRDTCGVVAATFWLAWMRSIHPDFNYWFSIGMILIFLLVILYWWRKSVKSNFAEPPLPSYIVP